MKSYPFTSKKVTYDEQGLPIYDRAVDSAFLRKVFSNYFSDGVFYKPTNALQVVADTGMQVVVEPGVCHIRGAMGIEDSRRTLVVQAAEELDRIDTVVARLDLSVDVRSVDLYVIKGTAAESPQPPALTRDSTKWEIGLANLFVAKNVSTITQQRITDTRLDNERCGVVAQTIGDLDTAPYFAQLTAAIAKHQTDAEAQIAALQAAIEAVEGDSAWMMQALYDKEGFRRDIFSDIPYSYKATFTAEAWAGEGPYTQTAQLKAMDGGPAVAADSILLASIGTDSTLGAEEKEAAQSAAALIAKGSKTLGSDAITVSLEDKPGSDVTVYLRIRKGAGHSVPTLDPVPVGGGMDYLGVASGAGASVTHDFKSGKYAAYIFFIRSAQSGGMWSWSTTRPARIFTYAENVTVYFGGERQSGGYIGVNTTTKKATLSLVHNFNGEVVTSSCALEVYGIKF